jgi:hypothetical protein
VDINNLSPAALEAARQVTEKEQRAAERKKRREEAREQHRQKMAEIEREHRPEELTDKQWSNDIQNQSHY